jgi:hypothetical protein
MNAVKGRSIYFEQPCETLDECLQVRRLTSNPIILDENIHTIHDIAPGQGARNASGETSAPNLPVIGVDLDGIEPGRLAAAYR